MEMSGTKEPTATRREMGLTGAFRFGILLPKQVRYPAELSRKVVSNHCVHREGRELRRAGPSAPRNVELQDLTVLGSCERLLVRRATNRMALVEISRSSTMNSRRCAPT